METKRITGRQLFALTAFFSCGTLIIYIASGLTNIAKQDAWISAAITPVFGMLFIRLYSYLGSLYPGKTLIDIIYAALGRWLGGLTAVSFTFLCFVNVPQVVWYVGNFVKHSLIETPIMIVHVFIFTALVIALFYGIEAIARSSEILIVVTSLLVFLIMILVSPKIKIDYVTPVFENGLVPVLKGSLLLISYSTWLIILMNMIYPSLTGDIKNARKSHLLGYFWGSLIIFLCTTMSIFVLGSNLAAKLTFPTFVLAQEVGIGSGATRLEVFISIAWIISLFFKALLYYYSGIISVSQILRLKDHKRIILPLGLVMLVLSVVVYPNSIYESEWDTMTWVPHITTYGVVLPVVLLLITVVKRKLKGIRKPY